MLIPERELIMFGVTPEWRSKVHFNFSSYLFAKQKQRPQEKVSGGQEAQGAWWVDLGDWDWPYCRAQGTLLNDLWWPKWGGNPEWRGLVRAKSLQLWPTATPWTVVHQTPLSMGFPRQKYWSGLPFPPPRNLSHPEIKPASPALTGRFFTPEPPGKSQILITLVRFHVLCKTLQMFPVFNFLVHILIIIWAPFEKAAHSSRP